MPKKVEKELEFHGDFEKSEAEKREERVRHLWAKLRAHVLMINFVQK